MIVFVPVSVYRVQFQVVEGRPYSLFERSLLEAVAENYSTLDALVDLLHVHRSVVVQGLVTLMQAGWVALGGSQVPGYIVTPAGRDALKKEGTLPENRKILERSTKVIMERIWRNLCALGDVAYFQDRDIEEVVAQGKECVRLPAQTADLPETNEARPFLRVEKLQFERVLGVGPITVWRHDRDWVKLSVARETLEIVGLPKSWNDIRLIQDIVEYASLGDEAEDVVRLFDATRSPTGEEDIVSDDELIANFQSPVTSEAGVIAEGVTEGDELIVSERQPTTLFAATHRK